MTGPAAPAIAETIAEWAAAVDSGALPAAVRRVAGHMLLDVAGLCVAARGSDYVAAVKAAWDADGRCTAIGHRRGLDAAGAALVNGTAAHGEDYDDTFESTPVHAGAVVVPAVLAACEADGRAGADLLKGIAVAAEVMCRMALVAPTAQHRAGFHPTAVNGAPAAAAGIGAALGLRRQPITDALGVAGSLASGIIEYLAEGAWSKRLHPGWAAQAGLRAARLGAAGFRGPRTVFEGAHGFFKAFGHAEITPDFSLLTAGLGESVADGRHRLQALRLRHHVPAVHRRRHPPRRTGCRGPPTSPMSFARSARRPCTAYGSPRPRRRGPRAPPIRPSSACPTASPSASSTAPPASSSSRQMRLADPEVLALAAKVGYRIDPANEYPRNYFGHVRLTTLDGQVHEAEQPHLRGGTRQPLSPEELAAKFRANTAHGGFPEPLATDLAAWCNTAFDAPNLSGLARLRSCAYPTGASPRIWVRCRIRRAVSSKGSRRCRTARLFQISVSARRQRWTMVNRGWVACAHSWSRSAPLSATSRHRMGQRLDCGRS